MLLKTPSPLTWGVKQRSWPLEFPANPMALMPEKWQIISAETLDSWLSNQLQVPAQRRAQVYLNKHLTKKTTFCNCRGLFLQQL